MRTGRELVKKHIDPPMKLRPVSSQTMHFEHILTQPGPEFLGLSLGELPIYAHSRYPHAAQC